MPSTTITSTVEITITLDDAHAGYTDNETQLSAELQHLRLCAAQGDIAAFLAAIAAHAWQRGVYIDTAQLLAPRRIAA